MDKIYINWEMKIYNDYKYCYEEYKYTIVGNNYSGTLFLTDIRFDHVEQIYYLISILNVFMTLKKI